MQVRNVLHAAHWKYRTQKSPKIRHLGTIAQYCRAVSSQLSHASTIGKKLVKQQYLLHMSAQYVNFGPLTAEISLPVWGTQQISTGFASCLRYCSDVAHRRPTKLCTMFGRLMGWYTVYTFSGALAAWHNFARCQIHFTSKSCVRRHWKRYCTALHQRASAKLRASYKEWNYGTFADGVTYIQQGGHHVGHRPRYCNVNVLVVSYLLFSVLFLIFYWFRAVD